MLILLPPSENIEVKYCVAEYLYIHVPFCFRKCTYCDFTSFPFDKKTAADYGSALRTELIFKRDLAGELKTVYIGGGTPSIMPEQFFHTLFACLRDNFRFSPRPEITIEANPGTLDEPKLEFLLACGVNRISMGIQSLEDGELTALGRIHTSREAIRAYEMAKEAGFRNISLDLMYGVPGQTMATWRDTLKKVIQLGPSHISAYELTPEKGTPLLSLLEEKRISLPDEELVLEMYDHAIDYLAASKYEQYEISNFALPGCKCLHNINYWDRGEYLAAGAGAHSFVGGVRTENIANIRAYLEGIGSDMIPAWESTRIQAAEAMRERLFLGLRKTDGIPLANSEELSSLRNAASDLIEKGYMELKDERLRLTRSGMVMSNTVIVTIFEKLGL